MLVNSLLATDTPIDRWDDFLFRIEIEQNELNTLIEDSTKDELYFLLEIGESAPIENGAVRVATFISHLYVHLETSLTEAETIRVSNTMIQLAESVQDVPRSSVIGTMIKMNDPKLLEYAQSKLLDDQSPWVQYAAQSLVDQFPKTLYNAESSTEQTSSETTVSEKTTATSDTIEKGNDDQEKPAPISDLRFTKFAYFSGGLTCGFGLFYLMMFIKSRRL